MSRVIFTGSGRVARHVLLAALVLAAVGACDRRVEGEFDGPAGFSESESAESALAPAVFARERGRLITRGLAAAEHPTPGSSRALAASLGAELAPHYDEGLRLVAPSAPDAFVELRPLGSASHAPARLRHDGALVAYDDAYPRVSAAVGSSDDRVETKLRVATAADAPVLRYRLKAGPAFGRWDDDEAGARWAYDKEGRGLFRLAPPSARGADGRVVEGRWRAREEGGETVVEADLPWAELAFPVLASVAFETPTWFPAGGATPPAPRSDAGLTFYGGDQNCAVLFGGVSPGPSGLQPRDDVAVRCEGQWQVGPGGSGITTGEKKPKPREDARLAYAPFAETAKAGAYLFGGTGAIQASDDLWKLTLHKSPTGERSATWEQIAPPDTKTTTNWPGRRFEAGIAWTGHGLLLFGGAAPNGSPLTDTWLFNGTTWQRICDGSGCFPARRGFAPFSRGPATAPEVLSYAGFTFSQAAGVTLTNQLVRFTGTGWQPLAAPTPATLPTLLDGTPSYQEGDTAAAPNSESWAAEGPGGQLLVGSGQRDFWVLADDDGYDVWRIFPRGSTNHWARVPVTTARPGRRLAAATVFDPVRQETLIVGGYDRTPSPTDPTTTVTNAPPIAYRARAGHGSMAVTCHDPDFDGDCNSYTLEAQAALEGDATPSRLRAVFLRKVGQTWVEAGPACGTTVAPLAPVQGTVVTCDTTASLSDRGFAVQLRDAGFSPGGTLCSPTPGDSLPFCNDASVYAGTVTCTNLPFEDGDTTVCP